MEAAESYTDDLPGPPPESLRRPYPELRKPISAKPKRSRPDPFPELRKPPGERRPPPEPFPELRKPALKRARPEPYPELRKPNRDHEDQIRESDDKDRQDDDQPVAGQDTAPPGEGEPERKRSGGWLSDVLKSAERLETDSAHPPFGLDPDRENEDEPGAGPRTELEQAWQTTETTETAEAHDPVEPDEVLEPEAPPASEDAADVEPALSEEADGDAETESPSPVDEENHWPADDTWDQAALLDHEQPSGDEGDVVSPFYDEDDDAGTEQTAHALPENAAREAAEAREQMDNALREEAAR